MGWNHQPDDNFYNFIHSLKIYQMTKYDGFEHVYISSPMKHEYSETRFFSVSKGCMVQPFP